MSPARTCRSIAASFAAAYVAPELRAWRGEAPLWKVFWGYGVCVSAVLVLLYVLAMYQGRVFMQQVLLLCFAAYTVWIILSVWRCSANAHPFWGLLARWLTVAWAGNATMVLVFLQLDLVMRYLRR